MRGIAAWWVRSERASDFLSLVERLSAHGFAIEAPEAGGFRAWGVTAEDADFWQTTPGELLGSWESRRLPSVAFQLWLGDDDTLVTLDRADGYSTLTFRYQGWPEHAAEQWAEILTWNALTDLKSLGLCISGRNRFDWDEGSQFLADPRRRVPDTADLVWFRDKTFHAPRLAIRQGVWPFPPAPSYGWPNENG